jgi:hypothetical protein
VTYAIIVAPGNQLLAFSCQRPGGSVQSFSTLSSTKLGIRWDRVSRSSFATMSRNHRPSLFVYLHLALLVLSSGIVVNALPAPHRAHRSSRVPFQTGDNNSSLPGPSSVHTVQTTQTAQTCVPPDFHLRRERLTVLPGLWVI